MPQNCLPVPPKPFTLKPLQRLCPLTHPMKKTPVYVLFFSSLLFIALWLLPACSGAKKAGRGNTAAVSSEALLLEQKLIANELQPRWFGAKAKVAAGFGNQQQSFGADIRLKTDSLIWMSVYATIGIKIEVARALITPDSVKVLDKFNKRYYAKGIGYLESVVGYPLDFSTLQQIVLGTKLPVKANRPEIEKQPEGGFCLKDRSDNLKFMVYIEPQNYTITRLMVVDSVNQRHLGVDLSNYQPVGNKPFAHKRLVRFSSAEVYEADIELSKIKVNEPMDFPFSVSDRYEVIH